MANIQPFNFSVHCAQAWRETLKSLDKEQLQHPMFVVMKGLMDALISAPKFQLNDGGRPIDDFASISRLFASLHLPFPCIALEYRCHGELGENQVLATKRISLVWDIRNGIPEFLKNLGGMDPKGRESLLVQSICYTETGDMWAFVPGMIEICMDEEVFEAKTEDLSPEYLELLKHKKIVKNMEKTGRVNTFPIRPYVLIDDLSHQYGIEKAIAIVQADSADEVIAAISFAAVSSCANVSKTTIEAPAALNKKRIGNGKLPFDKVHVLMVEGGAFVSKESGWNANGTHASPKTHLRRGHIRQLESKVVWVNSAVVNAGRSDVSAPVYKVSKT